MADSPFIDSSWVIPFIDRSVALDEEDDSGEFIRDEFIPMGAAGGFRSRTEQLFRPGVEGLFRSCVEPSFRSGGEAGGVSPPAASSGSAEASGTEFIKRSSSFVQTKRYTLVFRKPRCSIAINPSRCSSLT